MKTKPTYQELENEVKELREKLSETKSEDYFKELLKNNTDAFAVIDIQSNNIFQSDTFAKILGYTPEERIGKNAFEVIHPDDRNKLMQVMEAGIKKPGITEKISFRAYHKNGSIKYCEGTAKNMLHSPIVKGIIINYRDVTDRKSAEESLRNSEETFKGIFNNTTEAIYVQDEDGVFLDVNQGAVNMYGYAREELIGNTPEMVSAPGKNDLKMVIDCIQKAYNGEPQQFEFLGMRKNGEVFPKFVRLSAGNYFGKKVILAFATDITEFKKAEQELLKAKENAEESEYKVRSMFENTQIGILYCNAEGKILEANQVMLDILGSPSMEATLKINLLTFKPLQDNGFAQNVEKCISEKNIVTEDAVYTSKWGKTIFMKYYLVPVILNNKVIGVWANLNNQTDLWNTQNELITAKEKAQESDRLKSAFLANMSHEIRTPMNAILGFGSFLKDPELSTEKRNYFADIINRSANHLLNLINDIVDISKIDAGQMTVIETECKLNEFLFEIYQFFHSVVTGKQIEISIKKSLPDGFDVIKTDTTRLRQILINLIGNAVKFTNEGSIEIKYLISENNELEFLIKDSGIGISEKELPIIFNRFRQADETLTRNYGGTGLGLSISKACVELLGGKIVVKSEHGKGSIFSFTIPYKPVNNPAKEKETVHANTENIFAGKTILIAEDEPHSCLLLEEILKPTGAIIEKASNGRQAIDLCRQKPEIDIVLMDIQLPYIDGLSATKEILKFRPDLPIISQTANAMQDDREKSTEAGCVNYITKPIKVAELITKMQKCFWK